MFAKVALIALFLLIPPFLGHHISFIALSAINLGILTLSWHFMERESGWVSLGHSIPFGISAYLLAIDPAFLPFIILNFLIFLLLSMFGRSLFPFATLIASIVLWQASNYITVDARGGEEGFRVFVSIPFEALYPISAILFLISYLFLEFLSKSKLGLKINAVRDDEIAARSIGMNPVLYRAIAFFVSSAFASVSGIFHALTFSHVSPSVFSPFYALFPFVASAISFEKRHFCIFGSFAVVFLTHALAGIFPEAHYILYSAVLMVFAVLRYAEDS